MTITPRASSPAAPGAASKPTVLVAEDDPLALAALVKELRAAQFDTLEVLDGLSTLTACVTHNPALAVISHPLPGAHGVELARLIATQTSVPFIFLSTDSDESTVRQASEAGALAYLLKPLEARQIVPAVRTALQRAQEIQVLRIRAQGLSAAVQSERNVCIATGLLMARFHVSQQEAFERLRRLARSKRTRVEQIATELLSASDQAGRVYEALSQQISARAAANAGVG